MSDIEIVLLCQENKLENFWVLYEKYVWEIYNFIYKKTFDTELCEDLCSQTFLKALDKIQTFKVENDANFRAWLYRISYNLLIDNYKWKKEILNINEILELWYDNDFAKNLDNKNKLQEVLKFFETLKPKQKEILMMRLWDDLSYKEISQITGESIDNCKKIVSRTLANIPVTYMQIFFILLLSEPILWKII